VDIGFCGVTALSMAWMSMKRSQTLPWELGWSQQSWEVSCSSAMTVVARSLSAHGNLHRTIGFKLWPSGAMESSGSLPAWPSAYSHVARERRGQYRSSEMVAPYDIAVDVGDKLFFLDRGT